MTLMSDLFDDLDKPLPDIKITCTSVSCDDDLHCFLQPKRTGGKPFFGACRGCPADPVDWPQAHKRDPALIDELFKQQRKELIRYYMWSKPFDDAAKERVRKLGWEGTLVSIRQALRSSVGKAAGAYDGRQTKFERNVVFYAQHSTATCCRKCMKYWYDIPMDRALTEEEMGYCELVIRRYLEIRKPDMD